MLLVRLGFEGGTGIHWRLTGKGSGSFALCGTDWELLNPLLYHQTSPMPSAPFSELGADEFSGGTGEIVLLHRSKRKDDLDKAEKTNAIELGLRLLTRLRHVSGQAKAPQGKHLATIIIEEIDTFPVFTPVPEYRWPKSSVSSYWYGVAVTDDHIRIVAGQPPKFEPDVYETLFLDAIAAHFVNDFRTSVIYAAMSMEVAFGTVITNHYERIVAGSMEDSRYRVIRRNTANGEQVCDPVFERLKKIGENIPTKMHELSLYVMGRSLLIEDEPLYSRARTLYNTRNKLVHAGIADDSGLLSLDQKGSFTALETAKQVHAWLRVDSGICLPVTEFVPYEQAQAALKAKSPIK